MPIFTFFTLLPVSSLEHLFGWFLFGIYCYWFTQSSSCCLLSSSRPFLCSTLLHWLLSICVEFFAVHRLYSFGTDLLYPIFNSFIFAAGSVLLILTSIKSTKEPFAARSYYIFPISTISSLQLSSLVDQCLPNHINFQSFIF